MTQSGAVRLRDVIAAGVTGGLLPCPGALAVLIMAWGIGKPVLGLWLVLFFGLGIALTLTAVAQAARQNGWAPGPVARRQPLP